VNESRSGEAPAPEEENSPLLFTELSRECAPKGDPDENADAVVAWLEAMLTPALALALDGNMWADEEDGKKTASDA